MPANWPERLEKQYQLLEGANTTGWNKRIIRWFIEHYKPVSYNRKDKYIRYLKKMAILMSKSFNQMEREDISRFIQALEKRFPEEWTFVDCETMFKTFFRFYMDDIADREDKREEYMCIASSGSLPFSLKRIKLSFTGIHHFGFSFCLFENIIYNLRP